VSTTLRLLSIHLLLTLLAAVLTVMALSTALTLAGSGHHRAGLGVAHQSAGRISPNHVDWR